MWVAPPYRRLGIGDGLLERSIAWARSIGAILPWVRASLCAKERACSRSAWR
jgi:GNAT superfamily N-acetyltransferase